MGGVSDSDTTDFKQQELSGWDAKAKYYDNYAGEITRNAVSHLLIAAAVKPGSRILDVACGPGYVAGSASELGAHAVGVDFAPSMVAAAQRNYPDVKFCHGDAESLEFDNDSFDAVICAYGLLHLADPNKAISEAFRVLRPGGRFAFTVWAEICKHDFFSLVMNAIELHGDVNVPLPDAPPIFRFSDPQECLNTLTASGFTDIDVLEIPLNWSPSSPEDLLGFLDKSSVRMAMLLEKQTPQALTEIKQYILDSAHKYMQGNSLRLRWPTVLAAGRKPLHNL